MSQTMPTTPNRQFSQPDVDRPPLACVELDRFCTECGYNLRTQAVFLDQRTGIPLVRCPECGRCLPANDLTTALRPWLRRLTSLLLAAWMVLLVAWFVGLACAEGGLAYSTLDELTAAQGAVIRRIGNTTTIIRPSGYGPLEVRSDVEYYELFIGSMLAASFLVSLVFGMSAAVCLPHWGQVAYAGLVLVGPLAVAGVLVLAWYQEAPHLLGWGLQHLTVHASTQILGGLAGVLCGRPAARLTVRVLLPPALRPRLAYLWLVDGKPLPRP